MFLKNVMWFRAWANTGVFIISCKFLFYIEHLVIIWELPKLTNTLMDQHTKFNQSTACNLFPKGGSCTTYAT